MDFTSFKFKFCSLISFLREESERRSEETSHSANITDNLSIFCRIDLTFSSTRGENESPK